MAGANSAAGGRRAARAGTQQPARGRGGAGDVTPRVNHGGGRGGEEEEEGGKLAA